MKLTRALASSCTLLLASILAHILAGGEVILTNSAILISVSSLVISILLVRKSDDPLFIVLAIFAAQNLSHFILGADSSSSFSMVFAHASSGLLSYQLLRFFDKNLPTLGSIYLTLLPPQFKFSLNIESVSPLPIIPACTALRALFIKGAYSLRGPPLQ